MYKVTNRLPNPSKPQALVLICTTSLWLLSYTTFSIIFNLTIKVNSLTVPIDTIPVYVIWAVCTIVAIGLMLHLGFEANGTTFLTFRKEHLTLLDRFKMITINNPGWQVFTPSYFKSASYILGWNSIIFNLILLMLITSSVCAFILNCLHLLFIVL